MKFMNSSCSASALRCIALVDTIYSMGRFNTIEQGRVLRKCNYLRSTRPCRAFNCASATTCVVECTVELRVTVAINQVNLRI